MGNQLNKLEEEIKADEAGKHEFERQLAQVGELLLLKLSQAHGGSIESRTVVRPLRSTEEQHPLSVPRQTTVILHGR